MTAAREAIGLPLLFLTAAFFGGWEPGAPEPWTPAGPSSLVIALLLVAVLVRSGALDTDRLLHGSRAMLANSTGGVLLLCLFAASAQTIHAVTPRAGLPWLMVSLVLFLMLLNTLIAQPDRRWILRTLMLVLGSAFVLKFVLLDALTQPDGNLLKGVVVLVLNVSTLGAVTPEPLTPGSGYVALGVTLLYLAGVASLPARRVDPPTAVLSAHSSGPAATTAAGPIIEVTDVEISDRPSGDR